MATDMHEDVGPVVALIRVLIPTGYTRQVPCTDVQYLCVS